MDQQLQAESKAVCVCVPQWQVLLYLGDEPHAGIRMHIHGGQDRYDNKEPGGRAGRVHSLYHAVLLPQKKKQQVL